jgi:GT2 family glycosyltransferase
MRDDRVGFGERYKEAPSMHTVLIVGVSYNCDQAALRFINSLASISLESKVSTSIMLVDNTERDSSTLFFERVNDLNPKVVCIKSPRNLGYFGGARLGLETYLQTNPLPDWIIVSNVDLEFRDSTLLSGLGDLSRAENVGVIAPAIWSEINQSDWNPKIRSRPAKMRMHLYKILYRSYYIYNIYILLFVLKSRARHILGQSAKRSEIRAEGEKDLARQDIYAPHGACIIFSKLYFQRGGSLDYPMFLYGEEIFVAESARRLGLRVVYDPNLRVCSYDHVATGRFPRSRHIASYQYDSAVFIADTYFC